MGGNAVYSNLAKVHLQCAETIGRNEGPRSIIRFPHGLDDTFVTVKTQILSTKPTPSLGSGYHLVVEDEQHKHISTLNKQTIEVAAFQIQGTRNDKEVGDRRIGRKRNQSMESAKR
ncbi:hypothetical protein Salat_2524900 [Sesamum alatum]|uniref:Uncharacterized protein n=1 Tax=Sesamum alatum TaxID=300844 RepID=A0AAE1XRX9_9LAMI|nr:hypothetical protein Salat_2524900 [Sesamum alatum]